MNSKHDQKENIGINISQDRGSSSIHSVPVKNSLFGVGITNETQSNVLEYLADFIENSSENCFIVTPNPEMIVFSQKNPDFKSILNRAQIALCDGVGLWLAGRILGKPFTQRITGVDFMQNLCKKVARKPITVGFLGARPGVAEITADCLTAKYPGLKVNFVASEWNEDKFVSKKNVVSSMYHVSSREETKKNVPIHNTNYIIHDTIDILFVAFGFPKQEQWMFEHIHKIPVRVMMGVGGSFDYISGKVSRAPSFVRSLGLEWLYRLLHQPWRWKRQLALIQFVWLVVKEKFRRA